MDNYLDMTIIIKGINNTTCGTVLETKQNSFTLLCRSLHGEPDPAAPQNLFEA